MWKRKFIYIRRRKRFFFLSAENPQIWLGTCDNEKNFYLRTTRSIISGSESRISYSIGRTSSMICDLSSLSRILSTHWRTLAMIFKSLWFFSNTVLILGRTIRLIESSSTYSYTLATATNAALWICIVLLSNELKRSGRTSDRISLCGVFSRIMWRFSRRVTVAWIDFGEAKTILLGSTPFRLKLHKAWHSRIGNYLNVGRMTVSYSFVEASWTMASAGWSTAAKTSAARISCCRQGHTCCHQSF